MILLLIVLTVLALAEWAHVVILVRERRQRKVAAVTATCPSTLADLMSKPVPTVTVPPYTTAGGIEAIRAGLREMFPLSIVQRSESSNEMTIRFASLTIATSEQIAGRPRTEEELKAHRILDAIILGDTTAFKDTSTWARALTGSVFAARAAIQEAAEPIV